MSEPIKIAIVQGGHVETLWAEPLPDGHYRIDNIPLEIFNISLGDIVTGSTRNDLLYFDELYQKSGNQTIRIRVAAGLNSPGGMNVRQVLDSVGACYEAYGDTLLSANVPSGVDVEELMIELAMLAKQGVKYEQLDPTTRFSIPVVPGSPAQASLARAAQDNRKWVEDFVKGSKD
jgi:hypothetical protein